MTVIGTKATPSGPLHCVDEVFAPSELSSVLQKSDVLVLVVPATSDTHALLGTEEIAGMKPSAALINVARGQMVDNMYRTALKSGHLSGAG